MGYMKTGPTGLPITTYWSMTTSYQEKDNEN